MTPLPDEALHDAAAIVRELGFSIVTGVDPANPAATDLVVAIRDATGAVVADLVLGGGFGARYLPEDPEVEVAEYARTLLDAVASGCATRDLAVPAVHVEPGRSIVAAAAVTVYRVGTVKEIPGVGTYVAIDGGMSDNPRPVLYGAGYEAYLPARIDEARPLEARVAGKHCEQGDVIVGEAHLPTGVAPGDLLVTPVTGAYGYSMASNYNSRNRAAGAPANRFFTCRATCASHHCAASLKMVCGQR